MKSLGVLIVLFILPAIHASMMNSEFEKIRENYERVTAEAFSDGAAGKSLASMAPDGSWADIDYANTSRGHWAARTQLVRTEQIARAYASPRSRFFHRSEAREAILRSLNYWVEHDFTNSNWWYQSIGTPQSLCDIALCLGKDGAPPALLGRLEPILARSKPGMTGQNRVWLAGIHLQKGLLFREPEKVREGARIIESEVRVAAAGEEGIQRDWSYHQHGAQLQFGNYGLSYWADMTQWARILAGTAFAFSPEKIDVLVNYFNQGLRWTLFDGQMDFSACGRQNDRHQMELKFRGADRAAQRFQEASGRRLESTYAFRGNRFFDNSDYMIHRAPECFFSVKMSSSRVIGSESTNSENLLGRMSAWGATMVMSDRKEIIAAGALWNWRRLPGVTAVQDDTSLVCEAALIHNASDLVGGVSDGEAGLCGMELNNSGLHALKSYFFIGRTMVCVGTRISSDADAPVTTSVVQCHAQSDTPSLSFDADGALVHGAFAYRVTGKNVRVTREEVTGNWKRVTAALSDAPVSGELFSIFIDHGKNPRNAAYEYAVSYAKTPRVAVRRLETSSDGIHAIEGDGVVMAAFFEPGTVTLAKNQVLRAMQPAFVMLKDGKIHAADPSQKQSELVFQLSGNTIRLHAEGGKTVSGDLAPR